MIGITIMNHMHLQGVDLNLLPVLDALLRERHVTRAARRVGLSQSAMSHALSRLRELLGDPILVRSGRVMVPTERAEGLESALREALESLEGLLGNQQEFVPAEAEHRLHMAGEDFASVMLVPPLLARLQCEAPRVDLDVVSRARSVTLAELESKALDLAVGVFEELPPAYRRKRLLTEGFACVVRRGHPAIRKRLTLKQFASLPHALIAVGDPGPTAVGDALAALGLERRIALRVGHFLATPLIIAESDLVLTMPRRLAERFASMAPLDLHEPPVELKPFELSVIWHERRQRDPAHRYFRDLLGDVSATL